MHWPAHFEAESEAGLQKPTRGCSARDHFHHDRAKTAQAQPTPTPFPLPTFQARDCHYVDSPFVIENNLYIVQRTFTDPNNPLAGGGAYWDFFVSSEDDYLISGKVGMYDGGSNSFYLQVDNQPDNTMQFMSQAFTTGREYRYVTWPIRLAHRIFFT